MCAVVAAGLRLPFAFAGLTPDEGGYAYVAQQWSRGEPLYDVAWADRPQGLLVAFWLLLTIDDEAWAIRLGAVLCGAGITALLGAIGWQLRNAATGITAAAIYAVVGVGPRVNGFTFNGELAAALPATGAIAASLCWRSTGRKRWLVAAGLAGGAAVLMKQSGFDGLLVAIVVILIASTGWRARRRALAVLLASASVPLAASMLHGWTTGWRDYWYAVVGYRFDSSSALALGNLLDRPGRFLATADDAWFDLGPVVLVALAALVLAGRQWRPLVVPACWLGAALLGFHSGALYWRHYYVQLIPPLALLATMAVTSVPARRSRSILIGMAVLPVAVSLVTLAAMPAERRDRLIAHRRPFQEDQRLAAQLRDHAGPDDSIYVLVSRAELYFLVGLPSRYPYLWGHPVQEIPGALDRLRALLASERRPEWVIEFTPPNAVDPSGRLARALRRHYRPDPVITTRAGTVYRSLVTPPDGRSRPPPGTCGAGPRS